jgi:hypothetical protein
MGAAATDVLAIAAEVTAGVSKALTDLAAKPACLNSIDFECPRVAMSQSVSAKEAFTASVESCVSLHRVQGASRAPWARCLAHRRIRSANR